MLWMPRLVYNSFVAGWAYLSSFLFSLSSFNSFLICCAGFLDMAVLSNSIESIFLLSTLVVQPSNLHISA